MNRLGYLIVMILFTVAVNFSVYAEEEKPEKEQETEKKEDKKKSTGKVYAIKDKYGNIIGYTDTPKKGSEEIIIQKGTEYTPPEVQNPWSSSPPEEDEPKVEGYTNFSIASPSNDATIRNNAGDLQVAVDIRPPLLPGHSVHLLVDGAVVAKGKSPIMSVTNVDRGTHSISAQIKTAKGKVVKTTPAVTVHMHRATIR